MNDEIKEINLSEMLFNRDERLLDYITNLQQENERLNTELNSYKDEFCKDTIKEYELVMELEYYKSRCEKAIEYIEDNTYKSYETDYMDLTGIKELLNILNGD